MSHLGNQGTEIHGLQVELETETNINILYTPEQAMAYVRPQQMMMLSHLGHLLDTGTAFPWLPEAHSGAGKREGAELGVWR